MKSYFLTFLLLLIAFLAIQPAIAGYPNPSQKQMVIGTSAPVEKAEKQVINQKPIWEKALRKYQKMKEKFHSQNENPNKNGMWSLILLGIGLILSPLIIGFLFSPIAIILGIIGLKNDEKKTMSIWGIVLGSLGVLMGIALAVLFVLGLYYGWVYILYFLYFILSI